MIDPDDVMFFGTVCLAIVSGGWYKLRRREIELRAMNNQFAGQNSPTEIAALRDEIASLRDTTTKYDISVEQALTELQNRIATLEAARQSATPRSNFTPPSTPQSEDNVIELGRKPGP